VEGDDGDTERFDDVFAGMVGWFGKSGILECARSSGSSVLSRTAGCRAMSEQLTLLKIVFSSKGDKTHS